MMNEAMTMIMQTEYDDREPLMMENNNKNNKNI